MDEIFSVRGRRALVTGGSRGIGAAICELFARHGARLAVFHFNDDANAAKLEKKMSVAGYKLHSFNCDVADESAVSTAVAEVRSLLGGMDIVVNCAGIGGDKPFSEISVSDWDRMLNVHLRGTFLVTHAFFSDMVDQRWGRVINIASQLAYKGAPGLAHYCAAKAGIVGFTRALSYEGAPHNVMVNAIAPGPVETDLLMGLSDDWRAMKQAQLPIGRFGRVEEIAPTALLLASEAGAFYCGQTLSPNGGDVML
ncbi:3-oxoacyl-ACP reductase FabG [Mesorhizobium sp. M7A.F.Ca.US.006.01.1.1]|uniref:SDR family NAD(P)-dependent oxidoreductase n=1 Tax=Mesorhizobium sp. M7A.F.Ca.US.006.01.1.1 TaxID=2496707 RepID=UPI000FCCD8F6|nr:3-oxoacyl-ACP reductase family protein [Mesorhizobium sp. M7A.F.Ca.US.006.01.1.1]RUZ74047.1 3-oxoacyl-ACP reductase FabG [Mesorhizobium sp. M7A.F.Ca.US.006.01.1.1]